MNISESDTNASNTPTMRQFHQMTNPLGNFSTSIHTHTSIFTSSSPHLLSNRSQSRTYVTKTPPQSSASLVAGLASVALAAQAGKHAVVAYNEWQASKPEDTASPDDGSSGDGGTKKKGKKKNFFDQFGFGGPSKFYEGGFEDEMTRREAALILGVRESSSAKRIKDAHRTILIANHPDTGGSNFIASKVNEAKELLLKGKD
ncbi:hypothetical protein TrCOL_g487 [Triparma columacea]|uniref:J domain-containing protein n=1 Tax=Triparma columacea TaxID=722753 RepID=A0A9W7GD27_9STRA|nr:hypothetical protein TrCOL_g487 [Triparma columacea]